MTRFFVQSHPSHDPPSYVAQQYTEVALKGHHILGCRLIVDKLINESDTTGERARQLPHEGFKSCCQQNLDWRRMDHGGASCKWNDGDEVSPPFHQRCPLQATSFALAKLPLTIVVLIPTA